MIEIENLTVRYAASDKVPALDRISLRIESGERVALFGPNGAGKTTLLLAMVGLLPPDSGTITISGITLGKKTLAAIRKKAALMFQNPDDQLFMPSVLQDVEFGPRSCGMDSETVSRQTEDVMAALGISGLRDSMTSKLSGGEKRLAALAGILVMQPDVILLDEPTSFLDMRARKELLRYLSGLSQGMLITSHDIAFASRICGRAVLLDGGKILADCGMKEFMNDKKLLSEFGYEDD